MLRLIKIELRKIVRYRPFQVFGVLYLLLLGFVLFSIKSLIINMVKNYIGDADIPISIPFYEYPDIWENFCWLASSTKYFIGLGVVLNIANEYASKTLRQSIINGMSRVDFFHSKLVSVLLVIGMSALFVAISVLLLGKHSGESSVFTSSWHILIYMLDLLFFFLFLIFIVLLVRKAILSIGLFFSYMFTEFILRSLVLPDALHGWLPMKAMSNLYKFPEKYASQFDGTETSMLEIAIVFTYIVVFYLLSVLILKKRDL